LILGTVVDDSVLDPLFLVLKPLDQASQPLADLGEAALGHQGCQGEGMVSRE
jgi:hypothetical protein